MVAFPGAASVRSWRMSTVLVVLVLGGFVVLNLELTASPEDNQ